MSPPTAETVATRSVVVVRLDLSGALVDGKTLALSDDCAVPDDGRIREQSRRGNQAVCLVRHRHDLEWGVADSWIPVTAEQQPARFPRQPARRPQQLVEIASHVRNLARDGRLETVGEADRSGELVSRPPSGVPAPRKAS